MSKARFAVCYASHLLSVYTLSGKQARLSEGNHLKWRRKNIEMSSTLSPPISQVLEWEYDPFGSFTTPLLYSE